MGETDVNHIIDLELSLTHTHTLTLVHTRIHTCIHHNCKLIRSHEKKTHSVTVAWYHWPLIQVFSRCFQ